jgi:hypothetical protein
MPHSAKKSRDFYMQILKFAGCAVVASESIKVYKYMHIYLWTALRVRDF